MTKNNLQKGVAPLIIIIIILLAVGGIGYFYIKGQQKTTGDKMMEENKEGAMIKSDFETVIEKAPSITLKDVSQSGASGTAWLAVYNGRTYHRVIAQNMPALSGDDFYEGWLVKDPAKGDFFSTGKLVYDSETREARLDNYIAEGEKSDYRFVVITSEPNDGDPKPDKHIIEERFAANVDLTVVLESTMEKKENGAMMEKYAGQVIAGTSSPLLDFNKADYDKALASDKLVVLYFYANWCPICKEEVSNALYPAFNELNNDNVIGFRINYNDNQTDNDEKNLAREFGVAYQHTKVFLKNGERILKSPESWNKSRYSEEINRSL